MNKRIQELAEQAGMYVDVRGEPWPKWMGAEECEQAYQKFAELIVRECVKFCKHESNDDEHDEYDMGMWVKAESIKTAIMKEFGIKE
jgi:hypothetical protein